MLNVIDTKIIILEPLNKNSVVRPFGKINIIIAILKRTKIPQKVKSSKTWRYLFLNISLKFFYIKIYITLIYSKD